MPRLHSCSELVVGVFTDVRKDLQITQTRISGMANWGGRFVGDVERGKPTVRAQMLFELIAWLGLEIVIRKKRSTFDVPVADLDAMAKDKRINRLFLSRFR